MGDTIPALEGRQRMVVDIDNLGGAGIYMAGIPEYQHQLDGRGVNVGNTGLFRAHGAS